MALAVGYLDHAKETVVVSALREWRPPFSPEQVTAEACVLLAVYRIKTITGDRYAGLWCREQFDRFGVHYAPADRAKSDLYVDLLPLINSARIALPDNPRLVNQLVGLERRVARGGRDSIDHAPGGHDDIANAVAGLAHLLTGSGKGVYNLHAIVSDAVDGESDRDSWRRMRLYSHIMRQIGPFR